MPDRYLSMTVPVARAADVEKVLVALGNGPGPALVGRASPSGAEPATYVFLEGWHVPTLAASVPAQTVTRTFARDGTVTVVKGPAQSVKPSDIVKALKDANITGVALGQVVALLASMESTDESWGQQLQRKGLQRISDPV